KASLATVLSVAASLTLVVMLVPSLGGVVEGSALLMATLCPMVIAFPASFYLFLQKKRLAETLAALTAAHERLAGTHAELERAHARLAEKARHDDMTGLLNRESFFGA